MKLGWMHTGLATLLLGLGAGCASSNKANKQMSDPVPSDAYANPGANYTSPAKRTAATHTRIAEDVAPEDAVAQLVGWLRKDRTYQIPAEDQLKQWGQRQGVAEVIVRQVHPLLKDPHVEARAPALRLTVAFGGLDSGGDLIESLADSEYGMRETAFKALKARTKMDFGYGPSDGEVARAQAVAMWRTWWTEQVRKGAVKPVVEAEKPEPKPAAPVEKKDAPQAAPAPAPQTSLWQ